MSDKRISEIFSIVETKGTVTVSELVEMFGVSEATIRRDLQKMEDKDMIKRHYGGAIISESQQRETSLYVRSLSQLDEKSSIAKYAASLIHEGDIVYIDAGSTTSLIIDYITAKNILVVTQAINNISKLIEKNIRCYAAGGYLKNRTSVIIGMDTIEALDKMKYSISFIAGNGVHPLTGFTATEEMEAKLKQTIIKNSLQFYVVMDSSKFNKLNALKFSEIKDTNVITNELIDDFDYNAFKKVIYKTPHGFQELKKTENT